jgi:hypothetical protein
MIDYNNTNRANATIPYIIFKTKKNDDILPYNKDNPDVICDIEFKNPALDYAFDIGEVTEEEYKTHAPSFLAKDVTINVQGTSS